ncbi:MAG: V-type ATP synthase subunit D [Candidatus Heimdallarchaeota archaeon]|nr:V-type ATP synthase subunit D [Candidatus Heimdallarchaeota archaeon]
MSQVKLTRVELTDKRDQLDLAITGRDLLEDRLGALLSAFMQVAQEVLRAREDLIDLSRLSAKSLAVSSALLREKLILQAFSTPANTGVLVQSKNFMGTAVPCLEQITKTLEAQDESQVPLSTTTDQVKLTTNLFERQIQVFVHLACQEVIIDKLGVQIKKVRHRYNALENLFIPELKKEIQIIVLSLEEKEREENFKIRHFMKKRKG